MITRLSLLSFIFCAWIPQGSSAQSSSVEDKLFKLKPYQNTCPHTYKALELNQKANKLAKEGFIYSSSEVEVEMARELQLAFNETKTDSPCCAALAKIGFPCGRPKTSTTLSPESSGEKDFMAIGGVVENAMDLAAKLSAAVDEIDISDQLAENLVAATKQLQVGEPSFHF